jgi:hypothetical protein
MHLGLKTGLLCPILWYNTCRLKGALFFYQSSTWLQYLNSKYPQGPKRGNPDIHVKKSPSKSPVRKPPSMFPKRVPMERDALFPEPMVYSFIYIYWSPQKGALL